MRGRPGEPPAWTPSKPFATSEAFRRPRGLAPGARQDQRSYMSFIPFDTLPDDARLWCFGASRALEAPQEARLVDSMEAFVSDWTAHRRDLQAGFEWLNGQFLVIGVDESDAGASGCSIDALSGHLRQLGRELELDLLDSMPVWYRDPTGQVRAVSRGEFTDMARRGEVSANTPVFDLTLTRLGDLRAGGLEGAAGRTWHRVLLTPG